MSNCYASPQKAKAYKWSLRSLICIILQLHYYQYIVTCKSDNKADWEQNIKQWKVQSVQPTNGPVKPY